MSRARWNILPAHPDPGIFVSAGYSPILASLLSHRGIIDPREIERFLTADRSLCGDPLKLPGIPQAVSRIYRALLAGESIAVYGDFDADGVTATALMTEGLALLNGTVQPYIPHRMTEGYGLKAAALENLRKQGVSLIVSVDCGITALEPVRRAAKHGLDIIITDHHVPLDEVPDAVAVVDPRLPGCDYPFRDFSGAGVALKVLEALFQGVGKEELLERIMDLAAMGTVADLVPLLGENRYRVKNGLGRLNNSPRVGIREMVKQAGLKLGELDAESISWTLAPRLNAAGRLEHAMASYRLLTTVSQDEAENLATWLQQKNTERQELTTRALRTAHELLDGHAGPAVLVSHDEFPVGICGLVAGRLSDELYVPAVVIRSGDELSSGSCRSIPEFNIIEAMNRFQAETGAFIQYGGHAQAAGFTMRTREIHRFGDYLVDLAETSLSGVDLRPRIDVDAELRLSELGGDVFPTIRRLAPFGEGNPAPLFLSRGVEVLERRMMGARRDHVKLKLKQDGIIWNAVGFGMGSREGEIRDHIDVVYAVEVDSWNGSAKLRLNITDFDSVA